MNNVIYDLVPSINHSNSNRCPVHKISLKLMESECRHLNKVRPCYLDLTSGDPAPPREDVHLLPFIYYTYSC